MGECRNIFRVPLIGGPHVTISRLISKLSLECDIQLSCEYQLYPLHIDGKYYLRDL